MTRKRRRKYKLLQPLEPGSEPSARALAIVTIFQWAFWCALAGILVAFCLILSLFTHYRVGSATWLSLWPASIRLMTAVRDTDQQMGHLALWLTMDNALRYCLFGIAIGCAHVGLRLLRKKLRASRL